MDKYIGRLLDGRYEILEQIGIGGMAVVFKAMDHRLNRLVAVKILKDDYSRDEEFRKRFHAESQAVAMMSHPNIVNVYDVSKNDDLHYIVMELIEGISLKQYMETKKVLSWRETLHFSMQIARALEHAHSKGIIHRDIKPHNVMILKDGSIKVADFGIAHVASSQDTLTKEALGSVHYISPEQAKGDRVDSRSDLYSLGVVMYQMLTGRPPYDGETPVSVAIQHINGTPVKPSLLNSEIPSGLEQITMHAMCSDLNKRYGSATEMLHDMEEFRQNPLILFNFDVAAEEAGRTVFTAAPAVSAVAGARLEAAGPEQSNAVRLKNAEERRQEEEKEKKIKRTVTIIVSALAAVFLVLLIILILKACDGKKLSSIDTAGLYSEGKETAARRETAEPGETEETGETGEPGETAEETEPATAATQEMLPVSDYRGMVFDEEFLEKFKDEFEFTPTYEYSDEVPENHIISQSPEATDMQPRGAVICLTVSSGAIPRIPEFTGQSAHSARTTLSDSALYSSLTVKEIEEHSDTVEEGYIIRTEPAAGTVLETVTEITLFISSGPETLYVEVPNVSKDTRLEEAKAVIKNLGLVPSVSESYSDTVEEGFIISQSPPAGSRLEEGETVSITVSKGKKLLAVPAVIGQDEEQARSTLQSAGFHVVIETEERLEVLEGSIAEGTVVDQNPGASTDDKDTYMPENTTITLVIAVKPAPISVPNVVNSSFDDAKEQLEAMGFAVWMEGVPMSTYAVGTVFEQNPAAGELLDIGQTVTIFFALPPETP